MIDADWGMVRCQTCDVDTHPEFYRVSYMNYTKDSFLINIFMDGAYNARVFRTSQYNVADVQDYLRTLPEARDLVSQTGTHIIITNLTTDDTRVFKTKVQTVTTIEFV